MSTEIQISRKNQLVKNFDKMVSTKVAIINSPEVQEGLSDTEKIVAEAGARKPIFITADDEKFQENFILIIKVIVNDIGIKNFNPTSPESKREVQRFLTILLQHYKKLSLREVRLAFELSLVGTLDEYLPKDRNGNPDKNHYQSFSTDYVCKILNAYISYKNKIWAKATNLLPEKSYEPSEEDRKASHKAFIEDIWGKFNEYKENLTTPRFIASSLVMKEFIKQGVINEMPIPTEEDMNMAKAFIPKMSRSKNAIKAKAAHSVNHKNIVIVFDHIIKEGNKIEEVIKI